MKCNKVGGPSESARARQQAEQDLEEVRAEAPEASRLRTSLRRLADENHIAEAILASMAPHSRWRPTPR